MQRCAFFSRVAVVAAALSFASVADAQQLKPYFLVIFDTSGSMTWCPGGNESQYGANDCSCLVNTAGPCGGTGAPLSDSAFKQNRCGFPSNRLGDAKCALQRIVDATSGEAAFGLMQFEHPCSNSCTGTALSAGGTTGCTAAYDDGQLVVGIQSNNTSLMREWVDGTNNCQGTCSNNFTHELYSGIFTPIGKSLQRANEYLRGTPSGGFLYPTNSAGFNVPPASPLANDPQLACRPVSVILLTDGKETCGGNGTAAATALYGGGDVLGGSVSNKAFRTYVIGFGSSGDSFDPNALNAIAQAGGTDSPDPNNRYFPAANEAQLSVALTQIIADAQPPKEICNGMDDDCDGNADEGIKKFCDKPNGVTNEELCDEPNETKCDNIDDDCDGVIDEGLTNACGTCGDLPKEVCDNVDNDCDQRIDEDASTLEACGTDTGECEKGRLICVEGSEQCEGATGPGQEICDCKDNDCDGNTDEEASGDPLCPEDQKCAGCKCQQFCSPVQEFGNVCEAGKAPDVQPSGECICVADNCNSTQCAQESKQSGGDTVCAPGDALVGTCICQAGECVGRCVGVTCENGEVCNPKTSDCVENNCRGLGCAAGELCDPITAECVTDKCKDADCADDEVCRSGTCEKSCGGVRCATGETCSRGVCEEDKCAGKTCDSDQVCNPSDGECITDACSLQLCPKGQACSVGSGMCEPDPCWDVKCPSGQSCNHGECVLRNAGNPEAGSGGDDPRSGGSSKRISRLFATGGGGGCACSVPGPGEPRGPDSRLLAFGFGFACLAALRVRRRRKCAPSAAGGATSSTSSTRRRLRVLGLFIALACFVVLSGCKVTPLCLDAKCTGDGQPIMRADSGNAGTGAAGSDEPGPILDAGMDSGDAEVDAETMNKPDGALPMCTPTGPETCNGKDDDCDFRADEDVTAPANNCLQRGVCAGTAPTCSNGKFSCRYGNNFESDETKCDGEDNDCDGRVDESFPALGMDCEIGIGACKVTGARVCNAAGTSLVCNVTDPKAAGDEVCNGIDDDCDGMVDEPKIEPGMNPSYVHDDVVQIDSSLWVYKYEASRVDATDSKAGILTTRSCSRAGVLPWTDLTYAQAKTACESAGFSLCNVDDWRKSCKGQGWDPNDANTGCVWSYTSSDNCRPSSYPTSNACNGQDSSAQPGSPDTNALKPTGSLTNCYTDFGSAGRVFDLSGNAKEWTSSAMSPAQNPLRGGSYNNAPSGLECDFDFSVGGPDLHLPNVGFRCCTSVAP